MNHQQLSVKSVVTERNSTIQWLVDNGFPALPVAPKQDPFNYPKKDKKGNIEYEADGETPKPLFTGKNPSYLDANNTPHLLHHSKYQKRLPTPDELNTWFTNEKNGVGTLGSWNNIIWVDFDVKNFDSQQECDHVVSEWLQEYPFLENTFTERTHSGGWRFGIKVRNQPEFTNFALSSQGKHLGECLGKGRFTVLSPTIGPSGNTYTSIRRKELIEVEDLGSIGIYPYGKKKTKTTRPLIQLSLFPDPISLENLLSSTNTNILNGHNPTGDRSEALATLTQEAFGWNNFCNNNGIEITDNPESLVFRAGQSLNLDDDRINRILKTIDPLSSSPVALFQGGEVSCWRKIRSLDKRIFDMKCPAAIKLKMSNNDSPLPNTTLPDVQAVVNEMKEILNSTSSGLELEKQKLQLQQKYPSIKTPQFNTLWNAIAEDSENLAHGEYELKQINKFLQLGKKSLKLFDFLPESLAKPLTHYCQLLNIRPETVLLVLLTTTSSLHKVGTELVIQQSQDFSVPPTIFAAMCAESGQKKSPILRQIATKPLTKIKNQEIERFNEENKRYQEEMQAWQQRKDASKNNSETDEEKPEPPQAIPMFFFTDATGEGIKAQAQRQPQKALYALVDELAGFFKSANQYRGGKGSDRQDLLSYFDGIGKTVLRSDEVKVDVSQIYLSVFGTIQPEILCDLMRHCNDPDGQWARFLYVNQPLAAATLQDDDGGGYNLVDLLAGIYRKLYDTPTRKYFLSPAAFKLFQKYYNQLEQQRISHSNGGMRAVYSKAEGYTGRIALNLHVLHELASDVSIPSTEIPEERMQNAIALMEFFIGQTMLLYSTFDEGIAPHITKLIELSKRQQTSSNKGWLKAKDVQLSYNSKNRPKPDVIRSWMQEAEKLEFGTTRGLGKKLEYHFNKDMVTGD